MGFALCYVCDEYPTVVKLFGGIGTALREQAETFARRGRRVDVICRTTDREPGVRWINGVRVHVIKPCTVPKLRAVVDRLLLTALVRKICTNHSDIVIATEFAGPLLVKAFRNPLVVHIEGAMTVQAPLKQQRVRRLARFFERRTMDLADAIVATSRWSGEVTLSAVGARPRPVRVIPNSVDPALFYPSPDEVDPHRILFAAKMNRLKGLHVLPDIIRPVFARVPPATLTLVGADLIEDGQSCLEQFLARLDPAERARVRVTGRLSHADVAREMRRCAVMVLPSMVEICPVVVLEAMSAGRPVVASNRGGTPELLRDGETGLLADPDRPETFSDALVRLLTDPETGNAMGAVGRETVLARYTSDLVVNELQRCYSELSNLASGRERMA